MAWSAEKQREYYHKNPGKWRWYRRLWQYGLSREEFQALWDRQDGRCGICRTLFESEAKVQIDHDHKTEEVRGLLCSNCNRTMVALDQEGWLEAAQTYLKEASR